MSESELYIPTIDLRDYFESPSEESKDKLVAELRTACLEHGFFQITGHDVPVELQRRVLGAAKSLFELPAESKDKLSIYKNPQRRGYDAAGRQTPHAASLPDQKEGYTVGQDLPEDQIGFLKGPNVWPKDLPESELRQPVTEYFDHMMRVGYQVWEILVASLGHQATVLKELTTEPAMFVKLIRYPEHTFEDPRQFGCSQHTDYGGVTVLLQDPGKDGLEVWHEAKKEWVLVPAIEDKFVVNLGDMFQKWTGGEYKSNLHRVINKAGGERYSVPTFWHGNLEATNPLDLNDASGETVGQYIRYKFNRDYHLTEKTAPSVKVIH